MSESWRPLPRTTAKEAKSLADACCSRDLFASSKHLVVAAFTATRVIPPATLDRPPDMPHYQKGR